MARNRQKDPENFVQFIPGLPVAEGRGSESAAGNHFLLLWWAAGFNTWDESLRPLARFRRGFLKNGWLRVSRSRRHKRPRRYALTEEGREVLALFLEIAPVQTRGGRRA